jgi:hypothetical protein
MKGPDLRRRRADLKPYHSRRFTLDAGRPHGLDAYRSQLATHANFGITDNTSDTTATVWVYLTDRIEIGKTGVNLGGAAILLLDMTNTDLLGGTVTGTGQEDWRILGRQPVVVERANARLPARRRASFRCWTMWNYAAASRCCARRPASMPSSACSTPGGHCACRPMPSISA